MKQGEIYKYPKGTKVRIKDSVQCHQKFHDGGNLVFQDKEDVDKGEYRVGIQVEFGVCFDFHPEDYELIKTKKKGILIKEGIEIISEERKRQIKDENYTAEHDDTHSIGELANAASCYAMIPELRPASLPPSHFPWLSGWKPTPDDRIRELAKAGALIAAEIDRLQRKKSISKQVLKEND